MRFVLVYGLILFLNLFAKGQTTNSCGTDDIRKIYFLDEVSHELGKKEITPNSNLSATQFTIPTVFHIMHNNITGYVADSIIQKTLIAINKDFAREGSDTATIALPFKALYVNSNITFKLAHLDPLNNCTSGIVYHDNLSNGIWDVPLSANNPTYWPTWDPTKYLNIIIVPAIGGLNASAYASMPGNYPSGNYQDAVVSAYGINFNRVLSHEVGHWLGLSHIFGLSTNSLTCDDDNVLDTPPSVNYGGSSCPNSLSGNPCNGNSTNNIENIMHYSNCRKNFTQGQTNVMQATLNSTVSGRDNLSNPTNLIITGISSSISCTPKANFGVSTNTICAGSSIIFYDLSFNGTPTQWNWQFTGGTPQTSLIQNPVVTYTAPGTYQVKLIVQNGIGADSMIKISYIKVNANIPLQAGLSENFDNVVSIPNTNWNTSISNTTNPWQITSLASTSGTNCIYVLNTATNSGVASITTTKKTNSTSSYLTYKRAYAMLSSTTKEGLFVSVSNDCGDTWISALGVINSSLATIGANNYSTNTFVPTPNQWIEDTVYNIGQYGNELLIRLDFYSKTGNKKGSNLYIDDIQIHNVITTTINFKQRKELLIYPNPATNSLNINSEIIITKAEVLNSTGQIVITKNDINTINTALDVSELPEGIYFLQLQTEQGSITKKVIKE
ncbi:MAG: T9SS type A sorting domain-containing protein [Bacteroidia bacterium]|nr:T9SS type A sorting domain-containing protein [Bacteroidia bacterium]